jgi:hypothetical protein
MKDYCGYDGNGEFYKVRKESNSDKWLSECNQDCNQGRNCSCSEESQEESNLLPCIYLLLSCSAIFLAAMVAMSL